MAYFPGEDYWMIEWAGTRITDGTDRTERVAPALQVGYFNVDELVFEELLAMAAGFAAQIRFYNPASCINYLPGSVFAL